MPLRLAFAAATVFAIAAGPLNGLTAEAGAAAKNQARGGTTETVTVSNTARARVHSKTVLLASHTYDLVAQGTVSDWCSTTSCAPGDAATMPQPFVGQDALYCYAQWRCPTPQLSRQLLVNGMGLDQLARKAGQIPYSRTHIYRFKVTRVAGSLTFISAAVDFPKFNNSGAWKVEIRDLGPTSTPPTTKRAAPPRSQGGWVDELTLANELAAKGVAYRGAHKNLLNVSCIGLRYRGVRTVNYQDEFHRFQCELDGVDNHIYTANIWIIRSTPSRFWWQVTSITRTF